MIDPLHDLRDDASAEILACSFPKRVSHLRRSVLLEPLTLSHVPDLWDAMQEAESSWRYLRYGPFATERALIEHVQRLAELPDQPFFAILPRLSGHAEGWASFCDISPAQGSIEIGSIWFSPRMQKTRAGTEAMFLMLQHAFWLGYHRVAWRCNTLNTASLRAAERLGVTHEGVWREAEIVKQTRRDTAWFSILRSEWQELEHGFESWLDDDNFDASGQARLPLHGANVVDVAQG